jgi:hypothetical protein
MTAEVQNPQPHRGWYRLHDQGEFGIQIMHYKLDGTPGQCSTVDLEHLAREVRANEAMGYFRHEQPFSWERSRLAAEAAA